MCDVFSLLPLVVLLQNQTTERLRHFQANGGPQQSFEETIQRVSVW